MSEARDLLVIGSGLEARHTLQRLAKLEFGGRVLHLPKPLPDEERTLFTPDLGWNQGADGPTSACLLDVWGKEVLSFPLATLKEFEPCSTLEKVETLADGLEVKRTQSGEQGVTATLSDGSDILCQAVLFCDGPESECRKFWNKPVPASSDPHTVQCWSFSTQNLLEARRWEFRWATAKSVELIPLSGERLAVRLRFKSRHGGALSTTELQELFSEFGSDMPALFENLSAEQIKRSEELTTTRAVPLPAPGCLALGRAAWSSSPFLTFDWLARLVEKQLNIVSEQLAAGPIHPASFEAQSHELLRELELSELFFRRRLHSDNILLRPLRNLLLTLLPKSWVAAQIQKRLYD
ncbi:MAG: hypothetical protein WC423_20270 [Vulcanimicrobiota bacterium]